MKNYKGTREAFATAIMELAEKDDRIMFVSPDSCKAMRATDFADVHPSQYIECGIAEQGAVDTAAGLASAGLMPFVGTYAGFITMRACEQVRTFVAYPKLNVKFFGVNAGVFGGEREGATHQFYEDLAILSAIPNITILTPADPEQAYEAVKYAAEIEGPVYIRACSGREVDVFPEDAPFSKDGITVMKDYGKETLILSNGYILDRAMAAADLLKEEGINVTVADINILYPEDPSKVLEVIKDFDRIVTVEDHNINGGMGSYISRLVVENDPKPVKRIALTTFGESGLAKDVADKYGFSPENIANVVRENLG